MPELSPRHRLLVLAICCMSLLIVSLDNTVLNVALPSMQKELHASVAGLQWTIDAYTLVLASLLMLAGSTADRIGRRRVFKAGLVIFTLGSVLCSVAPNLDSLVAFRMVQAVGGSMLNPVAMSIITNTFTDPRERARAIGVWGGVVGISMAAGPIVGGLLVDSVGWRSIFWINLPVGLAALLLTWRYVPESRAPKARRPDPVGQLLVIALLGSLTYAIIEAPSSGAPKTLAFGAIAVAALLGLLWYEPRRAEPSSTCASSVRRRSAGPRSWPSARSPRSAGSCSSRRSICRTCAVWTRCTRACGCCPWRSCASCARRCRGGWSATGGRDCPC
jgi:Arabinose efflux permease